MSNLKIIIPSYKRHTKLVFKKWIPESFYKNVYVVVREEERDDYKFLENDTNVIYLSNITGIHDKRHEITKIFANEKIWMIDDDVTIHDTYNHDGWRRHYNHTINEHQFYALLDEVNILLDKYPYGVIRTKGPFKFSYGKPEIELNTWNYTNTFLNLSILNSNVLGYDKVEYAEDIWAFCSVHKLNYETFCYNKLFSVSPPPKKNKDSGGMSHIRNAKIMTQSHKKIAETFPEYVKLKTPKKQLNFLQIDDSIPLITSIKIRKRKKEFSTLEFGV